MDDYRHGAHSVFEIHLHLVWVTKYRKPVLVGAVGVRLRELVREICGEQDVPILKGHVSKDHVHLLVSIPPQVTISRLVQRLKGKTAYKMLHEFGPLKKQFWGRHLWARGYFCCSSGNVTDAVVAEYIANQGKPGPEDFRVEEGDFSPTSGGRASSPPPVGRLRAHLLVGKLSAELCSE
jgi:REP-associated tyrosine transposase